MGTNENSKNILISHDITSEERRRLERKRKERKMKNQRKMNKSIDQKKLKGLIKMEKH